MTLTLTEALRGCVHCGTRDELVGDGPAPLVCRRCIRGLGIVAANPYAICAEGRQALLDRSLDVLDLRDGAWRWTSIWPGAGDHRLIHGGAA